MRIQFLSIPLMIWMVFRCTLPFKTIHFDLWPVDFLPTPLALSLTDWPTKFWIIKALTPSIVRKFVIQPWLFSQLSALLSACSLSRRFHELPYSIEFNKNLNSKNIQDKWTTRRRIDLKVNQFRKDFLVSSNSSKKWTNKFVFSTVRQKNQNYFVSFWRNRWHERTILNLSDL